VRSCSSVEHRAYPINVFSMDNRTNDPPLPRESEGRDQVGRQRATTVRTTVPYRTTTERPILVDMNVKVRRNAWAEVAHHWLFSAQDYAC